MEDREQSLLRRAESKTLNFLIDVEAIQFTSEFKPQGCAHVSRERCGDTVRFSSRCATLRRSFVSCARAGCRNLCALSAGAPV